MNRGDAERVVGTAPRIRAIWQLLDAVNCRGALARRARPRSASAQAHERPELREVGVAVLNFSVQWPHVDQACALQT
jgi:hypothetical protein